MQTDELIKKYKIISDQIEPQELRLVLGELERCLQSGRKGAVVEFGCYVGSTSLFIGRLLRHYDHSGAYHVYDSFGGLPDKTPLDNSAAGDQFKPGELLASKSQFVTNFRKAELALPVVHKGWFADFVAADVPDNIDFAFLDGDYYQSIKDSFRLISPKLTDRAVIIVDDYANEALPGAAKATAEWLRLHPEYRLKNQASLAILNRR